MARARGRLIAFEGGEASGKSTQAARLAADLGAVLTREPGGTELGKRVREIVLDPAVSAVAPVTEALLMAADRAQHVAEGYRRLAADDPDRWVVVDGVGSIDEVAARVRDAVEKWLATRG